MSMFSVVLLLGLAILIPVECKECTTPSKPHLSRCDMFFKCVVLPSQTIVWIPSTCDRGLIYEPGLQLCVLPADTWECSLGEQDAQPNNQDDHNVYGVNNLDYLQSEINNYRPQFYDSSVNTEASEATAPKPMKSTQLESEDDEDSVIMLSSDSDEGGGNIEVVQDFASDGSAPHEISEEDTEGSGDEPDEPAPQLKSNFVATPLSNEHDGAVANHLQRLSQLIQSMSNAQQSSEHNATASTELTPNDLNAFLANYNIIAGFEHQQPITNMQKHKMSPDGKIPAERLLEILRLQQKIQKLNSNDDDRMPEIPIRFQDKVGQIPTKPTSRPTRPSTESPIKSIRVSGSGVSAAQIVVNRPEGSVMFTLPAGVAPNTQPGTNQQELPQNYISQETLKAVLELSKQMIASNSQQQQQNYVQQAAPVFRPVYYNVPIHDLPIPIISGYSGNLESNHHKEISNENDDGKMEKVSSVKGHVDVTGDDRTTVIHNHIPITIENRKASKPTSASSMDVPVTETRYDSFGEKIVTASSSNYQPDRIPYPPFNDGQPQQPSYGSVYTPSPYQQPAQQVYPPFHQTYQNYGNFPNQQQQPQQLPQQQQQHFLPFPNTIYPTTPHLSEFNVNSYVNVNTPPYPTLSPANAATAPAPPPSSQYSDNTPLSRPQSSNQPTAEAEQPDDLYNTINRYGDDNDDTIESYDLNLDADGNVIGELASSYQPQNERPSSDAASNLESKQSLENLLSQLKPINTGSYQSAADDESNKHKIVHYGSTFMTYQDYQHSVAPLLEQGGAQQVEVLTCVTGARQPNSQDCTKYFVCNAATRKVLDYVCPQFTAFNRQSRFCDAKTYAECRGQPREKVAITVDANRRNQLEAQQAKLALEQATRIRDETIRDQQLTDQLNQQTQFLLQKKRKPAVAATVRPATLVAPINKRKVLAATTTTVRPRRTLAPRKRIIKCSEPTKVRDSLSIYNYFTCFKGADGTLKALKQTCPGGLLFCDRMKVCTSKGRC